MKKHRKFGWYPFLFECADGSYFSGFCQDIDRKMREINSGRGVYFNNHSERIPVKLIFIEQCVDFREAYAKSRYLKEMNKKLRKRLIETKKWPTGGTWKKYLQKKAKIPI